MKAESEQVTLAIAAALRANDMQAVHDLIMYLAVKDPRQAQAVLDTINAAIEFGDAKGATC